MDMRTPLKKVFGLGSAKEGTTHFWYQRLTALANVPLTIFLVWFVANAIGAERAKIVEMLSSPIIMVLLISTIISFTWHMRLGLQVVIEDYVPKEGYKVIGLVLNNFLSLGMAGLSIIAVLKLGFGG